MPLDWFVCTVGVQRIVRVIPMAFYHDLNGYKRTDADWIASHLLKLRKDLRGSGLGQRAPDNLVIGSWNIRALGGSESRRAESLHYIAEIIDKFDICAVQEVKSDLTGLQRILRFLGPDWTYIVTDVTEGSAGNSERLAILYNTNTVRFRNLVGELVLPPEDLRNGHQIARTPFFASFQAGWFRFTLMTVHTLYGGSSAADRAMRAAELEIVARKAAERARDTGEVYVLIGDMNIEKRDDEIMQSLTRNGLTAPDFGATNLTGSRSFDQIAFTGEETRTHLVNQGKFDWRTAVFRKDEKAQYKPIAEAERGEPYANWDRAYETYFMSFEMSDHLPIFIELVTDYSDDYLRRFTG